MRVTYTIGAGHVDITNIEFCRTDGFTSYNNDRGTITITSNFGNKTINTSGMWAQANYAWRSVEYSGWPVRFNGTGNWSGTFRTSNTGNTSFDGRTFTIPGGINPYTPPTVYVTPYVYSQGINQIRFGIRTQFPDTSARNLQFRLYSDSARTQQVGATLTWGTSDFPAAWRDNNNAVTFTGLVPGKTYYWRASFSATNSVTGGASPNGSPATGTATTDTVNITTSNIVCTGTIVNPVVDNKAANRSFIRMNFSGNYSATVGVTYQGLEITGALNGVPPNGELKSVNIDQSGTTLTNKDIALGDTANFSRMPKPQQLSASSFGDTIRIYVRFRFIDARGVSFYSGYLLMTTPATTRIWNNSKIGVTRPSSPETMYQNSRFRAPDDAANAYERFLNKYVLTRGAGA